MQIIVVVLKKKKKKRLFIHYTNDNVLISWGRRHFLMKLTQ